MKIVVTRISRRASSRLAQLARRPDAPVSRVARRVYVPAPSLSPYEAARRTMVLIGSSFDFYVSKP